MPGHQATVGHRLAVCVLLVGCVLFQCGCFSTQTMAPAPRSISYERIRELDALPPEQRDRLVQKAKQTLSHLWTRPKPYRAQMRNQRWNGDVFSCDCYTLDGWKPWSIDVGELRRDKCYSMLVDYRAPLGRDWVVRLFRPDHQAKVQNGSLMYFHQLERAEAEQMVDALEVLGVPPGRSDSPRADEAPRTKW